MFDLRELSSRVVAAPMAGGPSTPELVVAAALRDHAPKPGTGDG